MVNGKRHCTYFLLVHAASKDALTMIRRIFFFFFLKKITFLTEFGADLFSQPTCVWLSMSMIGCSWVWTFGFE